MGLMERTAVALVSAGFTLAGDEQKVTQWVLASSVNNRSLGVLGLSPSREILGEAALPAVVVRWE